MSVTRAEVERFLVWKAAQAEYAQERANTVVLCWTKVSAWAAIIGALAAIAAAFEGWLTLK